jgi:hypothetical protein
MQQSAGNQNRYASAISTSPAAATLRFFLLAFVLTSAISTSLTAILWSTAGLTVAKNKMQFE